MKKIRVTRGGCGIKYTDSNGVERHATKTPESGPFECDDAQADRLVRLGVAAYVSTPAAAPVAQEDARVEEPAEAQTEPQAEEPAETEEPGIIKGHLSAAELETWDYNELKRLTWAWSLPERKRPTISRRSQPLRWKLVAW